MALALRAQWTQLQQQIVAPSSLNPSVHRQSVENEVLSILLSLSRQPEVAAEDAERITPYLLAFAATPLLSLQLQALALAALRGVLSSLATLQGATAAATFTEELLLGKHQAMQALLRCLERSMAGIEHCTAGSDNGSSNTGSGQPSAPTESGRHPASPPRPAARVSLLARCATSTTPQHTRLPNRPRQTNSRAPMLSEEEKRDGGASGGGVEAAVFLLRLMRSALCLLAEAAEASPRVAVAFLANAALIKASIRCLTMSSIGCIPTHKITNDEVGTSLTVDILRLFSVLLYSGEEQLSDAALVLCGYSAHHAVLAALHRFASAVAAPGVAGCSSNGELVRPLLMSLKVFNLLTRQCPMVSRGLLSESLDETDDDVTSLALLFSHLLSFSVAEVREAGAFGVVALLQHSPSTAAARFVRHLITGSSNILPSLVEMLQWREPNMMVYMVSAALCWRWMLLSMPGELGAVLTNDSIMLMSVVELICSFPIAASVNCSLSHAEVDAEQQGCNNGSGLAVQRPRRHAPRLPVYVQLIIVEVLHILLLSYALGSPVTGSRLGTRLQDCLSASTRDTLRRHAATILASTHDSYWASFPSVEVDHNQSVALSTLDHSTTPTTQRVSGAAYRQLLQQSLDGLVASETCTTVARRAPKGVIASPVITATEGVAGRALQCSPGKPLLRAAPIEVLSTVEDSVVSAKADAPRTIRGAILQPVSISTTSLHFSVVQRAECLGGSFIRDSMAVVLQLAQRYLCNGDRGSSVDRRGKQGSSMRTGSSQKSRQATTTAAITAVSVLQTSARSAVFGSSKRFQGSQQKQSNPFAAPAKRLHHERQWVVADLQRSDVVLFIVHFAHLMEELPQAIEAVADHMAFLQRQLQLCPTRDVQRRCLLNDVYLNVYPKIHLFLRYINQQARRSRVVLQLLSDFDGGTIHSGNVVEVYDAVGQCSGGENSWDPKEE